MARLMSVGGVVGLDIGVHGGPAVVKRVDDGGLPSLPGPLRDEALDGMPPRRRGRGDVDGPQLVQSRGRVGEPGVATG